MEHNHLMCKHSVFGLPSVNDHASLVTNSTVILSSTDTCTFGFKNANVFLFQIELENLVCTLSDLSLCAKHKTSSKDVEFFLVKNSAVALPALDNLL